MEGEGSGNKKAAAVSSSHAASVVILGRTFMRRLIDTMSVPKCQHHHVRLNRQFQSDIQWWSCFLPQWNGRTILPPQQAAHFFWSDAWGCGDLNDDLPWFKVQWPESWQQIHIAAKEMVPVVLAVAVWGSCCRSSTVQAFSDNMAVVCALLSGLARDPSSRMCYGACTSSQHTPDSHPSSAHSRRT